MNKTLYKNIAWGGLFWLLLVMAYLIYSPGIASGFLFDDFDNLDALGELGTIDTWDEVLQYTLSASGSTSGRILSVASFLINDNAWPSVAEPFKYTNVIFHLFNGALLFWLILLISRAIGYEDNKTKYVALIATALWLLHPLHISTVLYPVQRMAVLATLFVLSGLVTYVIGRIWIANKESENKGFLLICASIGVFTPLAILCKENGALLPILAGVLEFTVLKNLHVHRNKIRLYNQGVLIMVLGPIVLFCIYFAIKWDTRIIEHYVTRREFTLSERLMTEGRIIWDYISKLLLPRMQSSGLYYDNYNFSTSLITPATTLPALIGIAGLVFAALKFRSTFPTISCAVLFFLCGHLIESTFIPLELYFEHRNYLPSLLLFLPLAACSYELYKHNRKMLFYSITIIMLGLLSTLSYARANLWGNIERLALVWVAENPGSLRTQQQVSIMYSNKGRFEKALKHTNLAIEYNPDKLISYVNKMSLLCPLRQEMPQEQVEYAAELARTQGIGRYTIKSAEYFVKVKQGIDCAETSYEDLIFIIRSAIESNDIRSSNSNRQHLYYLLSNIYHAKGDDELAKESLLEAYQANPKSIDSGMQIVGTLATYGFYQAALEILDNIERLNNQGGNTLNINRYDVARMSRDYSEEISKIRQQIKSDMRAD